MIETLIVVVILIAEISVMSVLMGSIQWEIVAISTVITVAKGSGLIIGPVHGIEQEVIGQTGDPTRAAGIIIAAGKIANIEAQKIKFIV